MNGSRIFNVCVIAYSYTALNYKSFTSLYKLLIIVRDTIPLYDEADVMLSSCRDVKTGTPIYFKTELC